MTESKTSNRKITAVERREKAIELRKAGATYQSIADNLGVTPQAAHKMVMKVLGDLAEKSQENAEHVRSIELQRLDKLFFAMYQQAVKGSQGAVDRCLRIMDRRAKYLGLDAPKEVAMDGEIIFKVVHDDIPDKDTEGA